MNRGITKANYRTIDKGYADCMLLSWALIWKICNDSKILNSQMLLFVPIIEKWSRLIWLLLQEMTWSRIWDWEGWDKGSPVLKAASHDSQTGDGYLQPANDGGNIQHQLVRSAYLKTAHVAFLPAKTICSSFTGHRILTRTSKKRNVASFCHNNNYCFGKILERFWIGTDVLSADRLRQHRMTEK